MENRKATEAGQDVTMQKEDFAGILPVELLL